ncbi:MAG TPA: penicillin-binding protein 2 [Roseiflexaceae bacterium]|nr:penicillin-binding protein 2 [Roseiflexaceae bacterium]
MRGFLRGACALGAVALLVYGIMQPVEQDTRWLLSLWLAAPLGLVVARMSLPLPPRGVARSIQSLSILIGLGFVMLSLQLLRQQFVQADAIYNYVYIDEQTGQSTSNVRPVIQSQRIQRGRIFDRNDQILVDTQMVEGDFAVRTYPLTQLYDSRAFGSLVGYFSHRYGLTGLEKTYSDYLSGEQDTLGQIQRSLTGQQIQGDDLRLTINARLQDASFKLMGNRTGSVVVLDPKSGALLAMVSTPGFNPQGLAFNPAAPDRAAENQRISDYWRALNSDDAGQPLLNRPTQGRYPPGSTYKTITSIGTLLHPRQGRPNEIDCPNQRPTASGAPPVVNAVNDLASLTGNPTNLERVYAYSCNTAYAEYAMRLGPELMADVAALFDIYRPSEAPRFYPYFNDLPAETSLLYTEPGFLGSCAKVADRDYWPCPGLADTGYGQGQLFVTPLQMALVAATVANDGVMMQPYVVDRITRPDGSVVTLHAPRPIRRAIPSSVAQEMRKDMRAGVSYGFGKAAQQVDPSVALVGGKSGTAEHGAGAPHAWFIAIAPVDNPRYAVAVMVENGLDGAGVGAQLAGGVLAAAFALEP